MATLKMIKEIQEAANKNKLAWGYVMDDLIYTTDGYMIRFTKDPEIICICEHLVKTGRISSGKIMGLIQDVVANRCEFMAVADSDNIGRYKRGSVYEFNRDPRNYVAFPSSMVGLMRSTKKKLFYSAVIYEGRPVLLVRDHLFRPFAIIMGVVRGMHHG